MAKLTLDDIADLRAYERERETFRTEVINLKRRRRVGVGEHVTLVFENSTTIRFQIQEMARVEKLLSDEAIQTELRVYNPLVPEPGQLRATLFVELTTEADLRTWLPRLVGIEAALGLRLSDGGFVRCAVDPEHEKQLTREEVTASVHYIGWDLTPDEVERFAAGPVSLEIDHPEYTFTAALSPETHAELLADLRSGG
jgi:hypothetical protein